MKTITMHELLELVKNGKAPKKVLYDEQIYSYVDRNRLFAKYIREPFNAKIPYYLFTDATSMDDIVEILEEKKIPEKFKVHSLGDKDENGNFVSNPFPTNEEFMNKINEIIDYLKSKGE